QHGSGPLREAQTWWADQLSGMLRERRRGEPAPAATEDECGSLELRRLSGQVHGLSGVEILNNRLRAAGAKLVHPEADRVTGRGRREQELLRRPEEEHPST